MTKPYNHMENWMVDTAELLVMDKSITGSNDVYIVVKGSCPCDENGNLDVSGKAYFYELHTCPYNYLRFNIRLNNDNDDPHGIFQWVESVKRPENFEDMEDHELFDLFKKTKNNLIGDEQC